MVKVEVRDDISDTSAGAVWPMLTSVYFTLDQQKGEFRYPYTHPDYAMARDNTSGFLELWVDKSEVGTDSPVMIWQLQEHSDYNYLYPETSIKFEQISAHLDKIGHSRHRLAVRLIFASLGLWAIGRFLGFWNRRRQAIPRR